MQIRVGHDGIFEIHAADDMKSFSLWTDWPTDALAESLGDIGLVEGEHVWIDAAWVRREAPFRDEPAWKAGFEKMVGFARSRGWIDASGRIRAHIERP